MHAGILFRRVVCVCALAGWGIGCWPAAARAENRLAVESPAADLFQQLADGINRQVEQTGCTAAVVVRDLRRGDAIYLNKDVVFPAASLIKLPILVELYRQAEEGTLTLADTLTLRDRHREEGSGILRYCAAGTAWSLGELARLMIVKSDNTATTLLLERVGMENVNRRLRGLGLTRTRIRRNVLDLAARDRGLENTTTAYEMMRLLELIHRQRAAGPAACQAMLQTLLAQEYNDRIPRLLPAGTPVAHKTGTMHRLEHDVGIVFVPGQEFVICVLVSGLEEAPGERLIGSVAKRAYDYFAALGGEATATAGLMPPSR